MRIVRVGHPVGFPFVLPGVFRVSSTRIGLAAADMCREYSRTVRRQPQWVGHVITIITGSNTIILLPATVGSRIGAGTRCHLRCLALGKRNKTSKRGPEFYRKTTVTENNMAA